MGKRVNCKELYTKRSFSLFWGWQSSTSTESVRYCFKWSTSIYHSILSVTPGLGLLVSPFNDLRFRNTESFLPMAHNYYVAERRLERRSIVAINTNKFQKKKCFYTVLPHAWNINLTYRIVAIKLPLICWDK